ncbi:MAG: heparan-alpha-glucosaminide N-acetyltransferase [Eubacteriales bacterium]|nr:heparan-alpha-glucosaminide N-acetyltransferase [Eubacteriales bacterium]
MKNRIWELDFVRGVAITFVVIFHTLYDMQYIYRYHLPFSWQWLTHLAGIFILIAGICAPFSRSNIKKGLILSGMAIAITIGTYIYDKYFFIQFGILHLLAFCMLTYPLFKRLSNLTLAIISVVVMTVGMFLNNSVCPFPHLYILGWADASYQSMDWFPIMPYVAYFTIGILISRCVYERRETIFKGKQPLITKPFSFIGRYTLWVYLLQQPITLAVLELLSKK